MKYDISYERLSLYVYVIKMYRQAEYPSYDSHMFYKIHASCHEDLVKKYRVKIINDTFFVKSEKDARAIVDYLNAYYIANELSIKN